MIEVSPICAAPRRWVALLAAAVVVTAAGCAGTSSTRRPAPPPDHPRDRADDAASREEEGRAGDVAPSARARSMPIRSRADLEATVGRLVHEPATFPPCTSGWERRESSELYGRVYECAEFDGPRDWQGQSATLIVDACHHCQFRVALLAVSVPVESPSHRVRRLIESYRGRCEMQAPSGRPTYFDCNEVAVDISRGATDAGDAVRVVYADSLERLEDFREMEW